MSSFKKKKYTEPVISNHQNDLSKDWYVFFRFKHDGKIHSFKRREGINRKREIKERLTAIQELRDEIAYDLKHGWNPLIDKKREIDYNPYLQLVGNEATHQIKRKTKKQTHQELVNKFYYKGL